MKLASAIAVAFCVLGSAVGITFYFQSIFGGFTTAAWMLWTLEPNLSLCGLPRSQVLCEGLRRADAVAGWCRRFGGPEAATTSVGTRWR